MPTTERPKSVSPNPRVLQWAVDYRAARPEDLGIRAEWLSGTGIPTYVQLENLANQLELPLAIFFQKEPPASPPIPVDFRQTLQRNGSNLRNGLTKEVQRVFELQAELREAGIGIDATGLQQIRSLGLAPEELAGMVRRRLGISIEQRLVLPDAYSCLKSLRESMESLGGLFVIQITLDERSVSGFALAQETPALIALRAADTPERRQFTLAHEFYHLVEGASSAFLPGDSALDSCSTTENQADQFAAELLLPLQDPNLQRLFAQAVVSEGGVKALARQLRLSYSFVLRRFRDLGRISTSQMRAWWPPAQAPQGRDGGGGDYYRNQVSRLGRTLTNLVFEKLDGGHLSPAEATRILRVKVENFEGLRASL